MVTKDEAISLIKRFVVMARTQFGKTVRVVRSDNALELGSSEALSFFAETGIKHETSCVYTPQQNGWWKGNTSTCLKFPEHLCFNHHCH